MKEGYWVLFYVTSFNKQTFGYCFYTMIEMSQWRISNTLFFSFEA